MTNAAAARLDCEVSTAGERRVHVIQGEYHVTSDSDVVLTTILGSCVSACIRDPLARVGGMNHFLLPGVDGQSRSREAESYGVHLMELLVNGLLQRGARRERLEAKLFGGGRTVEGLSDVGSMNAAFAMRFLENERIAVVGSSLRGDRGRRIQFWPLSGRARQVFLAAHQAPAPVSAVANLKPADQGNLELF